MGAIDFMPDTSGGSTIKGMGPAPLSKLPDQSPPRGGQPANLDMPVGNNCQYANVKMEMGNRYPQIPGQLPTKQQALDAPAYTSPGAGMTPMPQPYKPRS